MEVALSSSDVVEQLLDMGTCQAPTGQPCAGMHPGGRLQAVWRRPPGGGYRCSGPAPL
jgi:hypothetical protein